MSDEAEKAWLDYTGGVTPNELPESRHAFMAGRASRDAEVDSMEADCTDHQARWVAEVAELRSGLELAEANLEVEETRNADYRAKNDDLAQQLSETSGLLVAMNDLTATRKAQLVEWEEQIACFSNQEDRIQYLANQLAEREAVIDDVAELIDVVRSDEALDVIADVADVILNARAMSPSTVLADHDARVLEEAADDWGSQIRNGGAGSWLRERAAERRKGTGQ